MNEKITCSGIWESNLAVEQDDPSIVDGKYILARVSGPSFFPDKTSRNHVHYPRQAWENALNDETFQKRLANRQIYGTIGHDVEMNDESVRAGNFSHIVSKVWIDENGVGNAEYLILNTPPGKILNTLFRAGSKIYVSTKAGGEFARVEDDIKYVDPNVFFLERIDFVIDPGFLETDPQLLESYKKLTQDNTKKMTDISESKVKEMSESLEQYRQLGSPEQISKGIALLEEYIKLGTVKKIKENLDKSSNRISQLTEIIENRFKDIGEALEVEKMKTLLEQYKELGTPAEIKKLIKIACDQHKIISEAKAKELSKKYSISESFIVKQYNNGMKMSEIEEMLKSIREEVLDDEELEAPVDSADEETPSEEDEAPVTESEDEVSVNDDDEEVDTDIVLDEPEDEEEEEPEEGCSTPRSRRLSESFSRRSVTTRDLRKVRKAKKIEESKNVNNPAVSSLLSKLMK